MNEKLPLMEGGLYATRGGDGHYRITKILALDDHIAHLRCYSNRFDEIPFNLKTTELKLGGLPLKPGDALGIGHMPVSREAFEKEEKRFLLQEPVSDDELDGYRIWAGIDPIE